MKVNLIAFIYMVKLHIVVVYRPKLKITIHYG